MIFAPFILFSMIVFLKYYERKAIDIAILISLIYGLSGFISIYTDVLDISTHSGYRVSTLAGIVYCSLLFICLRPFIKYSNLSISNIKPIKNEKIIRYLAWVSFLWFLFTALISWSQFMGVITGDMAALRQALYNGTAEVGFLTSLPMPIRFVVVTLNMLFGCGWILIFLAFFSLTIQKMSPKYFVLFFVASLSGPWNSILGVDRSGIAIYVLSLLSVIVFFWSFLKKKAKFWITWIVALIFGALFAYLAAMTFSRFSGASGNDTEAVQESLIGYLGQCYIEFCYFFDKVNNPDKSLNLLFPCISKYILGESEIGGVMLNQAIESKTRVFTGVFLTYLGQIELTAGFFVTLLFCLFFSFFSNRVLSTLRKGQITPFTALAYLALAEVMILGQYSYYYQLPQRTFSLIFFLILFKRLSTR